MFRTATTTPNTAASTTASSAVVHPEADVFSVVDVRTASEPGLRLTAAAAGATRGASISVAPARTPVERRRVHRRRDLPASTPHPRDVGRRTATSSGYRPR
ncbi:hypothetical protein [Embleya sp. NBC_00896]|uniref:hypothetical protein n=1 Tax=Embleya sp. NBC_00896 TaxID=2975961 RepID=UPI00386771C9|nr:hypothetical protein OG928_09810 [Embleya sp. NBC_00896]